MHVNNVSNAFLPSDSPSSVPCKAVCLERGTHVDHILHPLPKHVNRDGVDIRKWVVDKCQRAEFGFISYAPNPAIIYYISETGHRKLFWSYMQRQYHDYQMNLRRRGEHWPSVAERETHQLATVISGTPFPSTR